MPYFYEPEDDGKLVQTKPCPACNGTGSYYNPFINNDEECEACEGYGVLYKYSMKVCRLGGKLFNGSSSNDSSSNGSLYDDGELDLTILGNE